MTAKTSKITLKREMLSGERSSITTLELTWMNLMRLRKRKLLMMIKVIRRRKTMKI